MERFVGFGTFAGFTYCISLYFHKSFTFWEGLRDAKENDENK